MRITRTGSAGVSLFAVGKFFSLDFHCRVFAESFVDERQDGCQLNGRWDISVKPEGGYLHADGYPGYHKLPERITVVGCLAHARRKFADALKVLPMEQRRDSSAAEALQYFAKIAAWEKKLESVTPEKRYKMRQEKEKPILDALYAWAEARKNVAPKSALGKALYYLREQRPYLERYLLDGCLESTNYRAERSIKPFVIDRKNFLFANAPDDCKVNT